MAKGQGQLSEQLSVETLPAEFRAQLLSSEDSMFFNIAKFEHAQRVANMFAASDMVPQQFQGKAGNCMIALNYALRIGADPFMMLQTMHIIHGKPGIEGKLVAALINQSGKYREPLGYQWLDDKDNVIESHAVYSEKTKDGRGCRAFTKDAKSGQIVYGPKISWNIVYEEGWFGKNGSKWKTMPELMFMYRSASWFANVHCPEVKLGMHTVEEIKDFVDMAPGPNGSYSMPKDQKTEKAGANVTYYPDGDAETPPNQGYSEPGQEQTKTEGDNTTETGTGENSEPGAENRGQEFKNLTDMELSTFLKLRTPGLKDFAEQWNPAFQTWPPEIQRIVANKFQREDKWAPLWDELTGVERTEENPQTAQNGAAGEEKLSPGFLLCPDGKKVAFFQCEDCDKGPTCQSKADYIESQKT
jgi:hypothetical protein